MMCIGRLTVGGLEEGVFTGFTARIFVALGADLLTTTSGWIEYFADWANVLVAETNGSRAPHSSGPINRIVMMVPKGSSAPHKRRSGPPLEDGIIFAHPSSLLPRAREARLFR